MRWNRTCSLVERSYEPDAEGVVRPAEARTEAFCNEFSIGASTWSSMYEIGISADVELQVRSCDYAGQRDVEYGGERYSVEVVKAEGDFTRLTLRHQQSDYDELEGRSRG